MACGNRLLTKPWMTRRPWSDLRELCPDLHQRVMETKGAPKELVEEATEALDKIYINSNNTLKLVFFDKTKSLEDLCFSGIVDIDGNCSENDEERIAALAKYIYARKVSNNKYHVVFAPTPADTNATKIAKKATACSAAENKRIRAIKSKISIPLLGSDDHIGLETPSKSKFCKANPTPAPPGSAKTTPAAGKTASPKTLTTSAAKATTDPTIPNTATNTTPAIWFPKECHF
ncbi:hypothetical protein BDR26DRAFT_1013575 [Obelidium mucronatum]|nr:hypothetical protein BDR26DRAFT_1013575 [Obelidium mucronatum]